MWSSGEPTSGDPNNRKRIRRKRKVQLGPEGLCEARGGICDIFCIETSKVEKVQDPGVRVFI
jgi:hypothetical protein